MRLFNRESPRILANRIFLAPSCSAPAYRLRRNRTPSGKILGKNRRAGFSYHILHSSFFELGVRGRDFGAERPAVENRVYEIRVRCSGDSTFVKNQVSTIMITS